jgi:uncharacterized protein (UPF0297 family)
MRVSVVPMMCFVLLDIFVASAQEPQKRDQGADRAVFAGLAGGIALMQDTDVRQELGIRDDQGKVIRELLRDVIRQMQESGLRPGNQAGNEQPEERRKFLEKRAEVNREAEDSLARILDDRQARRLEQLKLQVEGPRALTRPEVAKEFSLTEEQRATIRKLLTERDQAIREIWQDYDAKSFSLDERREQRGKRNRKSAPTGSKC